MAMAANWTHRVAVWGLVVALVTGIGAGLLIGTASARSSGGSGALTAPQPFATVTTNVTSTGQAGYTIIPSSGNVNDVKASWNVPKIASTCPSSAQYANFWVGIASVTSTTFTNEMIGTSSDCSSGSPTYVAWYQFYPSTVVFLGMTIHSGDHMHGEVQFNTTSKKFTATLKDLSTGKTFFVTRAVSGAVREAAQWIASTTAIGGVVQPLADYGSVTFSNASVTISGHTHSISGYSNYAITMWNVAGTKVKAKVGTLQSSGTKFTVTWKSAGP
jgi:hypothetical protein